MIGFLSFIWFVSALAVVALLITLVVFAVKHKPKKRIGVSLAAVAFVSVALMIMIGINAPPRPEPIVEVTPSPSVELPSETPAPSIEPSSAVTEPSAPEPTASALPSPSPSPTTPPFASSSESEKPRENVLLGFVVTEHNVISAIGNNVVGLRAYVEIPRSVFLSASPEDVQDFITVRYEKERYNWLTVAFGDGTGILFNVSPNVLDYSNLLDDGSISNQGLTLVADENGLFDLSEIEDFELSPPASVPVEVESAAPTSSVEAVEIVYWGHSGNKIHKDPNCRTIKNGVLSGTIAEAKAAGHTGGWCGVCS